MILNSTFCLYNSLCRTARSLRAIPVLQVDDSTFRVLRAAGAHLGGRAGVSPRIDVSAQPLEIWTPHTHLHWQVTDPQVKFLRPFVSSPFLSTIFNKLKCYTWLPKRPCMGLSHPYWSPIQNLTLAHNCPENGSPTKSYWCFTGWWMTSCSVKGLCLWVITILKLVDIR